jgi:hypothetical protein
MKHLLMGVYQVCANKSPWVKLALQRWGLGAYIQVSDLRAIMALLFVDLFSICNICPLLIKDFKFSTWAHVAKKIQT